MPREILLTLKTPEGIPADFKGSAGELSKSLQKVVYGYVGPIETALREAKVLQPEDEIRYALESNVKPERVTVTQVFREGTRGGQIDTDSQVYVITRVPGRR